MAKEDQLALIDAKELSFVNDNSLNENQLAFILRRTPDNYIKKRPGKGGGTWKYVTGGYIKKCLNLMFGWDWSFEIVTEQILHDEVIVKGKLTCNSGGKSIVKMQFGNKDIAYRKQTDEEKSKGAIKIPLSIGNDLKAAATDCLKKCAAEIGLAADVYNAEDFKETKVDTSKIEYEDLKKLFEMKEENLSEDDKIFAERVLDNREENSYKKLHKYLKNK